MANAEQQHYFSLCMRRSLAFQLLYLYFQNEAAAEEAGGEEEERRGGGEGGGAEEAASEQTRVFCFSCGAPLCEKESSCANP